MLAAVLFLSSLGAVSIWAYSRMTPDALHRGEGEKQLVYLAVAFGCMVAFQAVDYRVIGRWAWPFYVGSLLLVVYTLAGKVVHLPGIHEINGANCWINVGPVSLEPSELVKVSFVMVLARYLRFRSSYRTVGGLLWPFALALLPVALILKQPDLGIAALFVPTLLAMLFVAGAKVRHMATVVGLGLAFVPVFWLSGQPGVPVMRHLPSLMKEYQRGRVRAMLLRDPAASRSSGYQQQQALTALGSGGWTGKGIGHIPVGCLVPEAQNDMVFALIGEQLGLAGAFLVLGAYGVLFAAGIEIASNTKEPFGRLVAVGIVAILATQTGINLMVCLRMMPVTGVTLPFVSYGGSSLLASYMAAGLLLNVGQSRTMVLAPQAFEFDHVDD